jgi:phage shock protein A
VGMENEKIYTLEFTESQLYELRDILDSEVNEWIDKIDNPCEEMKEFTRRIDRVKLANETMEMFEVVKSKIDEIYVEEEN